MASTAKNTVKVRDSERNTLWGPKLQFEIAEFEIANVFKRHLTVNAQGTRTFVRDSKKFEITHVRDSER